ncbi:hypothetical protein ABPG75_003137 [Micractinium tetrahymenae]
MEGFLERLRALREGFAKELRSPAEAQRLLQQANELVCQSRLDDPTGELRRELLRLADVVEGSLGHMATRVLATQFVAGCLALAVAASSADALSLPAQDRRHLASATAAVLGRGAALLMPPPRNPSGHMLCFGQLSTLGTAVVNLLPPKRFPREAAVFATEIAPPDVVLPVLAAAADMFADPSAEGMPTIEHLCSFCNLAAVVLEAPAYAKHREALAASPAQQAAIAGMLLRRGLASVAAEAVADPAGLLDADAAPAKLLHFLPHLLKGAGLRNALGPCLHQPGGTAALRHVAAILRALPASRPAGLSPNGFASGTQNALALSAITASALGEQLQPGEQHAVEGGAGSRGGSSSGAVGVGTQQAGASMEAKEAAWELLQALPSAAAALQGMAADSQCPQGALPAMCALVAASMCLLEADLRQQEAPPAQAQAWAGAAEAWLLLHPLMLAASEQCPAPHRPAFSLLLVIRDCLWRAQPEVHLPTSQGAISSKAAAEGAKAACQLWRAHSTACRLTHWLAADSSRQRCGWGSSGMTAAKWRQQGALLDALLQVALAYTAPASGHEPSQ